MVDCALALSDVSGDPANPDNSSLPLAVDAGEDPRCHEAELGGPGCSRDPDPENTIRTHGDRLGHRRDLGPNEFGPLVEHADLL